MTYHQRIIHWLGGDDTGLSSKHMATVAAGCPTVRAFHPLDSDDFGRCLRLVEAIPGVRDHFSSIAATSSKWAIVIANWDELEALYRAGSSLDLHRRMKALTL